MTNERMARWLGPLAVGLAVCIVLGFFILSNGAPDQNASPAEVVAWYRSHGTRTTASIYVVGIGLGLLTYYLAGLRKVLRNEDGSNAWLADTAFAGGLILVASFGAAGVAHWAVIDAANNNQPTVAATFNFIDSAIPVGIALGIAVLGTAAGMAILTASALPRWVGYLALVMGVAAATGFLVFFALLALPIWMAIVGFMTAARSMPREVSEPGRRAHRMQLRHHH